MNNSNEWLEQRIAYLKGLRNPSEEQQALLILADMKPRDETDEKKFAILVKAERATERAEKAKGAAKDFLQKEKKAARDLRTHKIINGAGLMMMAGLMDSKTGNLNFDADELLGAFIGIANLSPEKREQKRGEWKQVGTTKMNQYKMSDETDETPVLNG
jgi:Conjugal transfer protein TraD.